MPNSFESIRDKSRRIDSGFGKYAGAASRFIWPWQERWLLVVIGCLAVLDFASTYALLDLSGKKNVYESGRIASQALEAGGFPLLFGVDIAAVTALALVAFVVRYAYVKNGHSGFGRAAFVFLLVPYAFVTGYAIVNNIILVLK
jgi:hypothetical protein